VGKVSVQINRHNTMAHLLRSYDAFAKPIDSIRERSVTGGYITILALTSALLLLLSLLVNQLQTTTRHSMHLAESIPSLLFTNLFGHSHKLKQLVGHHIPLRVHVTFPHVDCASLDYSHDGNSASGPENIFAHYHKSPYTFTKRKPTVREYLQATVPATSFTATNVNTNAAAMIEQKRLEGCTLLGTLHIPRVGGTITVSVSPEAWRRAVSISTFGIDLQSIMSGGGGRGVDPFHGHLPNVTHYIHDITFGSAFPPGSNPLIGAHHIMDNGSGVALASVIVKLVPTSYIRPFHSVMETYQASVARHIVQPETLANQRSTMLPGLLVTYDFTPLAVKHVEHRGENFLIFLSSMIAVVGGVYVTVSAVSGMVVDSVQAVAKKLD